MKQNIIVKKSKIEKLGIFAAKNFKKGEVVLKWKSKKTLTKEQVDKLSKAEKHYVSSYVSGEYLFQQAPERYVNHSCNPNTEVKNNCDVAIKDIKKGEEITSDYAKDNLIHHIKCRCSRKECKGFI